MCTNMRYVVNRFNHKRILVPCGKCPACRQSKANKRAARIRNSSFAGYTPLFVTLTYDNAFVPYVLRSDLEEYNTFFEMSSMCDSVFNVDDYILNLPVRRDADFRFYRGNRCIRRHPSQIIEKISMPFYPISGRIYDEVHTLKKFKTDAIGVCYYADLQNFVKRLRINLARSNYAKRIFYYGCSEYGPTTHRPHFHLLIFVPTDDVSRLKCAIARAWPYANSERTRKFIQVAVNAASYVASYVNCTSSCVAFFKETPFKMSHSYSQGFGMALECFSLRSVLEKVKSRNLVYSFKTMRQNTECILTVPLPKYVINRYFPKFTGYFLVTDFKIRELLLQPIQLCEYINNQVRQKYRDGLRINLSLTKNDAYSWYVRVWNIYDNHFKPLGWSRDYFLNYYPVLYTEVWSCYFSTCLFHSFKDIHSVSDYGKHYYNLSDVGYIVHSDLQDLLSFDEMYLDCNRLPDVVSSSCRLTETFYLKDKNRKVVNKCLSERGYAV